MMSRDDINKIESALNIKLPKELVDQYMSTDFDDLDRIEELGLTGYRNFDFLNSLFIRDPERLIKINQRLRKRGIFKKPWKDQYFAIGYNGKSSNYYFINLTDSRVVVYLTNRTKEWAYDPNNLTNNLILSAPNGLQDYLDCYLLLHLNGAKEEKARSDAGIPERVFTTQDVYDFLEKLGKGESVEEYFK